MKHHTLLIGVVYFVLVAVIYAIEEPSITFAEPTWPDRFAATVESYQIEEQFLHYIYDNPNNRDRVESGYNNVTIRSKKDNGTSTEIRWDKTHVTLPVKCEERTLEDWSLMPKDWFSQFNKTLVYVSTSLPDYNRNFAIATFQWRFRVKAAQLASLFFVPKAVPAEPRNRREHSEQIPITKVKNVIVTVASSLSDPSWPERWNINYDLPDTIQNQYYYVKSMDFTVKKAFIEELVPFYFDKLFEVPTYIKECTKVDRNPSNQAAEDEEEF